MGKAQELQQIFSKKKLTLSLAESCTGGAIAASLARVAGASEYFKGCIVSYTDEVKIQLLGVHADVLKSVGAVSHAVALQMWRGAIRQFQSEVALSVTGFAGPTGGNSREPLGQVYIAYGYQQQIPQILAVDLKGSRLEIIEQTVCLAQDCLLKLLTTP